ncbi:MAG: hypothetical protein JWM40_892 [Frankiales bacterium]|nr:hypothetical protein [Frankiales bacterium]
MATGSELETPPKLHESVTQRPNRDEGLSVSQQERIEHAVSRCRSENGLDVSVLVGDLVLDAADGDGFRDGAERLHAALGDRAHSAVLIVVAPGQRRVEVVTGPGARRRVPDRVAGLAVLSMVTAFRGGDLAGGLLDGLRQIAQAAGKADALPALDSAAPGSAVAHH